MPQATIDVVVVDAGNVGLTVASEFKLRAPSVSVIERTNNIIIHMLLRCVDC
jgi:L-2-hydroxyglutarate oxidase LhgO